MVSMTQKIIWRVTGSKGLILDVKVPISLMHPPHSDRIHTLIILVRFKLGIPARHPNTHWNFFKATSESFLCRRGTVENVLTTAVVSSFHICSFIVGTVSAVGVVAAQEALRLFAQGQI
jgi:hypothetical protein